MPWSPLLPGVLLSVIWILWDVRYARSNDPNAGQRPGIEVHFVAVAWTAAMTTYLAGWPNGAMWGITYAAIHFAVVIATLRVIDRFI